MSLKAVAANTAAAFNPASPGPIGGTSPANGRFTGLQANLTAKTTAYTATSNDFTVICDASGGAFTVTLPASASNFGRILNVKKIDASANAVTVKGNASEVIDGSNTRALSSQYQSIQIQCDGGGWWVL